jgi:hypothetical protein
MMNGSWNNWMNVTNYRDFILGGSLGALIAALFIFAVIFFIALYIYFALAWRAIARKRGYKHPWLAWVPVANIAMWLQMGGFSWAWIFLMIIPIAGWIAVFVLFLISTWKVFEKLKYPGWLGLSPLLSVLGHGFGFLAYGIIIGIVAWKKKR